MIWQPVRHRLQSELIRRGFCVGCTRTLATAYRQVSKYDTRLELVFCTCRRIYIYDRQVNNYKRARQEEINQHINE